MDPVSHCLLGRALVCLDREGRLGPGAVGASMLGALAPDLDILLTTQGWDVYLEHHETGTHTLVAAPLLAAAVTGVVLLFRRRAEPWRLFFVALAGVIVGHDLFDLASGGDIRLFAPLSSRLFGPRLLTMADISAIVVLLAGTGVSLWRRRSGGAIAVAGLAVLLAVKGVSLGVARDAYEEAVRAADGADVVRARPEAVSGSLLRWRFYDRAGAQARAWTVDAFRRRVDLSYVREMPPEDAVTTASRRLPVVQRFLRFAELPFARVERDGNGSLVLWSDWKYCGPRECALSFGAQLDERRMPVQQVIQIGGYRQVKPLNH